MPLPADSPFHSSSFTVYLVSRVVGNLAFQMQAVAIGWQMYSLTGDPLDLGLVGLVQFLPAVLLVLPVGHVADRFDRRRVVMLSGVALAASLVLLMMLSASGDLDRLTVFALVFAIGVGRAFQVPSAQALVPNLVDAVQLPKAIAWSSISFQSSSIVGPALGGFLYLAGPTVVYGLCAMLWAASALLMFGVTLTRQVQGRDPVTRGALFAGFAFVRAEPVILGAMSLDLFMVLLGGATALMPVFASEILHVGPWGLGLLRAAPGIGAILVAGLFTVWPIRRRVGRWMFVAAFGFGVSTIVFGLSRSFVLSMAALVSLGAFDMINVIIRQSIIQLDTPDAMRGRVASVNSVFIGASNRLGEFESGLTAAWWGVVPATVVGGFGTMAVALLWMRWFPVLWQRDRLQREPVVVVHPPIEPASADSASIDHGSMAPASGAAPPLRPPA